VDMVGSWTESFDHPALLADGRSPRPKPILRVMPPGQVTRAPSGWVSSASCRC